MWRKILSILSVCLITACQPSSRTQLAPPQISEVEGTKAQRIETVTKILVNQEPLPSPLQDAYFLQQKIGDGELGPSDYVSFAMLDINPGDLSAWRSKLLLLKKRPGYAQPQSLKDWWVTAADYPTLELYELSPYTNRIHGWIGIDPKTSKIYVFTFTT